MASKSLGILVLIQVFALTVHHLSAFPTPASADDKTVHNRQLTEERPVQEQIAEADNIKKADTTAPDTKQAEELSDSATNSDSDDFTLLKSLAEKSKQGENETPKSSKDDQFVPDEADSTKNRRLADDYDSTKNGMDYKDDPESFRQLDGTPLTAEDIVQKIAKKIYEEDDRGVFDRIVSKLLKLGLITDSQADTLEYEVAEALQDLITKNAKDNEIDEPDMSMDYPISRGDDVDAAPEDNMEEADRLPSRRYEEDEEPENVDEETDEAADTAWDAASEGNDRNELSPVDSLQDLQYFPNFYRLLKSLDSEQDAEERETLITIMKTLIDFVKMMVKYGTITPEEGVSYLENLDAMIALQTKNKLGQSLGIPVLTPPTGKLTDDEDNTKAEAAKMQKEYELLKDSTKNMQAATETSHPGKSETYLEAIRKNIEWLKKHNKDANKEEYDLSKLRDFMDQQVDTYIDKGILEKEEGEVIKRIYGSM
ncbi:secretogranin-3 [Alosa alosa]|uniref:secretogranin-3 n=1 Tax=Alosa sapidissima TaxID=34773 RepID=UPI001C0A1A00|nr:secretogranin-3 [Alosa sapidissima]XP_048119050.1 secretogranin-3 [Alosa alosa]